MFSRSIRSKWRALSNSKDTKSPWGLFYCVLELYYYAVIEYCSKMIISQTGKCYCLAMFMYMRSKKNMPPQNLHSFDAIFK